MRVPLLISCPRLVPPGVVDDRVVSTADLLPTLATLFGLADANRRDGLDWLAGLGDPRRAVYMESLTPALDYGWAPLYGLRRRTTKLVLAPRSELYDLASDPRESDNRYVAKSGPGGGEGDELRAELLALVGDDATTAATPPGTAAAPLPDETRRGLAALGYAGGAGAGASHGSAPDPKDMIEVVNALLEANARLAAGRPGDALPIARRAVAAFPADRNALQVLGKVYLRLQRPREAELVFRRFRAIQPKADVSLLLAQIVMLDGRFAEAAALLAEAERLDPRHGGIFIARGDLLLQQGDGSRARAAYEQAARVDPYRAAGISEARLLALEKTGQEARVGASHANPPGL